MEFLALPPLGGGGKEEISYIPAEIHILFICRTYSNISGDLCKSCELKLNQLFYLSS